MGEGSRSDLRQKSQNEKPFVIAGKPSSADEAIF